MRFHILGLAHVPTREDISTCAYSNKARRLASLLFNLLGHEVFFYGVEGSKVECTEFVQCLSSDELKTVYGEYDYGTQFFKHAPDDAAYTTFNVRAAMEIRARYQPNDLVLYIFGSYQKLVRDQLADLRLVHVEPGIGYTGVFTEFRVFESYAWMHYVYGREQRNAGLFFDAVIPNGYSADEFTFSDKKDDYLLFLGRVIKNKGIEVAVDLAKATGNRLIVAGQGNPFNLSEGLNIKPDPKIEFVGAVGPEARASLLAGAKALLVPTLYIGPFEGVSIEAAFSGTPTITTDFGCFCENVIQGVTGWRCRTLSEFVHAVNRLDEIDPEACYRWACDNFSIERVAEKYEVYFQRLMTVYTGKGWYDARPESDLDVLKQYAGPFYA